MSLIDKLLTVLAPYECLVCQAEGSLLCAACTQQLTRVPEHCHRCREPSPGALTCYGCSLASNLYRVWAGEAYSGVAKDLVWQLKSAGAQAAARQMSDRLSLLLTPEPGLTIVPVPTATRRVRGRGYDQARLLARELSRQTRLPYLDCLIRSGHTHQVGSSRLQRHSQLEGAFRARAREKVRSNHILLVDDVMTTGATLEAAAATLKMNGAERVSAMVFARA